MANPRIPEKGYWPRFRIAVSLNDGNQVCSLVNRSMDDLVDGIAVDSFGAIAMDWDLVHVVQTLAAYSGHRHDAAHC